MAYTKKTWTEGTQTSPAKVTIDGTDYNVTPETRTGATPATANDLNNMENGIAEVNIAGIISMFAGSTAPAGWFLCQGQAVSRTEYANLFSAIGTTYGTGDGSTTFNLPNLKGRVIVGQDTSDTNFNALGETGGATEVTLGISEIPIHSHNYYGIGGNNSLSQNSMVTVGEASGTNLQKGVSDAGGGQPHNNLQPYIVMNYIIKI